MRMTGGTLLIDGTHTERPSPSELRRRPNSWTLTRGRFHGILIEATAI
jgi:hypothetical protein